MHIKAIVFKTVRFNESKNFFSKELQFGLAETSHRHFVIFAGRIRIVFIACNEEPGIEIYITATSEKVQEPSGRLKEKKRWKDPNGITIILL